MTDSSSGGVNHPVHKAEDGSSDAVDDLFRDPADEPNVSKAETGSIEEISEYEYDGEWPVWWKKMWWDIWRRSKERPTDGLKTPVPKRPYWLTEPGSESELVLSAAKATRAYDEERLEQAVIRASRLLNTALILLAIGFVSAGFLLDRLLENDEGSWIRFLLLFPSLLVVIFLTLSALQALGVDRVGLGMAPSPGPIAEEPETARVGVAAHEEVKSALITRWVADKKLIESNSARRSLSRGIVALIFSGIVVLAAIILIRADDRQVPPGAHLQDQGHHEEPCTARLCERTEDLHLARLGGFDHVPLM